MKLFRLEWLKSALRKIIPLKNETAEEKLNLDKINTTMSFGEKIPVGKVTIYDLYLDDQAIEKIRNRYIAFDVETTGLNSATDKIIEIGAVLFENGKATKRYETLVNAEVYIPAQATAIHHITNEMIATAPKEEEVYRDLVEFLGDVMTGDTAICAHNTNFDMAFLFKALLRFGYTAEIYCIDTLDLSRKLLKELPNHKQDTIVMHFGIVNSNVHRASSDAETCGKILWHLLDANDEARAKIRQKVEQNKLTDEEMELCAYIQNLIVKNEGDIQWLEYSKNSSHYVEAKYLYSFLKFKFSKKGKYLIVETEVSKKLNFYSERCSLSEGGPAYSRVYFCSPFELEPLNAYILNCYNTCRESAIDYFKHHKWYERIAIENRELMNVLSSVDVDSLLNDAKKRQQAFIEHNKNHLITTENLNINPIHSRVELKDIRHLDDPGKGFDEGYSYFEKGEELRKAGKIEEAIYLFDEARSNGYQETSLYESYAKAYHQLKDYDNEIHILNEGIERQSHSLMAVLILEKQRDKAIQLLVSKQEKQREKQQRELEKMESKKTDPQEIKIPKGRPILQFSTDLEFIKRYESIADAVRETGVNSKSIRSTAKGIQKHAGGYIWKYADEYEEIE